MSPAGGLSVRVRRLRIFLRARWAVVVLVGLPVLIFAVPAAAGYLLVNEDDLIQNYPLRALVGQYLRHGHLPLWDPFIWSGTPLLAGFNAGAFYPATLLFAVLPAAAAWATNEVLVYLVGGLGLWVFLRRCSATVPAAFLGAITFTFAGFMSAQLAHIDTVEAASLLPWMLLAIRGIAVGQRRNRRSWALLLGGCFGLVILAGSPEAILDEGIVLGVYALGVAWRHRQGRLPLMVAMAGAGVVALAIGALQWLPGLAFVGQSQRAASSFAFFTAGSVPPQLGVLAVVPFVLGSYGQLAQPVYFGTYNLPELTTYVGILPLVAGLAMVGRGWRRRGAPPEWRVWYAVIAVGAVLALGRYTPLSHLLVHIPLYGRQRLPSRNLVDVDLGLCVLLAFWFDGIRRSSFGSTRLRRAWDVVAAATPAAVAVTALVWLLVDPYGLAHLLEASTPTSAKLDGVIAPTAVSVVLAVVGGILAVRATRRPSRRRLRALGGFVAVDLVLFMANQYWFSPPSPAVVHGSARLAQALAGAAGWGPGPSPTGPAGARRGRFAVYDPQLLDYSDLEDLGEPDLNVLTGAPSVNGYGSIVSGRYDSATGTHAKVTLDPRALAGSTFDQLDLSILASLPGYFLRPVRKTAHPPFPGAKPLVDGQPLSPAQSGQAVVRSGRSRSWFFGTTLSLSQVQLHLAGPVSGQGAGRAQVGLLGAGGTTHWLAPAAIPPARRSQAGTGPEAGTGTARGTLRVVVGGVGSAVGVAVRPVGAGSLSLQSVSVVSSEGDFELAGALHAAVTPPHWRFDGSHQGWAFFANTAARGWVWADGPGGRALPAADLRVVKGEPYDPATVQVISPQPLLLVRSVSMLPGWSATETPVGGAEVSPAAAGPAVAPPAPTKTVAVVAHGLVQGVPVPAGRHLVTFAYRPDGVALGEGLTGAGVAVLLAGGAWEGRLRWRAGRKLRSRSRSRSRGWSWSGDGPRSRLAGRDR